MAYEYYSDEEKQVLFKVNIKPYHLQKHVLEAWLRHYC